MDKRILIVVSFLAALTLGHFFDSVLRFVVFGSLFVALIGAPLSIWAKLRGTKSILALLLLVACPIVVLYFAVINGYAGMYQCIAEIQECPGEAPSPNLGHTLFMVSLAGATLLGGRFVLEGLGKQEQATRH
jgi:hypothetical protein